MEKPVEYEFVLPDGTRRYEIVYEHREIFTFMKMHQATVARPLDDNKPKVRRD